MIKYEPGRTVPYWAPGAANYLANMIRDDDHCFEWGGGVSTPWLARLVTHGTVMTLEDEPVWIERIKKMIEGMSNVTLINHERMSPEYVDEVDRHKGADVYLIDGYQRIDCLKKVKPLLSPGNILVLDDALDYVADWKPSTVQVFSMPHPYRGKRVTKSLWRNTYLKVGDLHHKTKETWIWRVV